MAEAILKCTKRTETGKGPIKRLRSESFIPGIIYTKGENIMISMKENEYVKFLHENHGSAVINLEIDDNGKKVKKQVFTREISRRIHLNKILHIDFQEIEKGKRIKYKVPLKISGSPVGVKLGGTLNITRKHVNVEFPAEQIPWCFEVNIEHLGKNQSFKLSEIKMPETFKLLDEAKLPVAVVMAARGETAAEIEASNEVAANI